MVREIGKEDRIGSKIDEIFIIYKDSNTLLDFGDIRNVLERLKYRPGLWTIGELRWAGFHIQMINFLLKVKME
jgi:hypothetical protein